jgi:hypothetical protein
MSFNSPPRISVREQGPPADIDPRSVLPAAVRKLQLVHRYDRASINHDAVYRTSSRKKTLVQGIHTVSPNTAKKRSCDPSLTNAPCKKMRSPIKAS